MPSEDGGGGRWSLDNLFLDQDAIPTLVEVKRSTDTRIRREVLGQMLDYAANAVVYWPIEQLQASFVGSCQANGHDPDRVMAEFLGVEEVDVFWKRAKTNLQAGRVRLVFLADKIPRELQRVVEFLNEQMDPAEVLAVEVPRFAGEGLQTLSPRVVGLTAGAQRRKSAGERGSRTWDEASFLAELEANCGGASGRIGERIIEWAGTHLPRQWFGTGPTNASFVPTLDIGDESYWPFGLYMAGQVEIKFQYLLNWPPFDDRRKRIELLERLNQIAGVQIPLDRLEKRPSFSITVLEREGALDSFLATMEWCVAELRSAASIIPSS